MLRYRTLSNLLVASLLVACGGGAVEDDATAAPDRYPALEAGTPIDWTAVTLGVGLRHGEAIATAHFAPTVYGEATSTFSHAVLYVQSYDEAASVFGEYHVYPAPDELMPRTLTDFILANAGNARFERRASDLYAELDEASMLAGSGDFESRTVVFDALRIRRDWWARWDGNLDDEANRKGKGNYGFNRKALVDDLLGQVEAVAAAQKPDYFIIGHELERILKQDQGDGLAPAELSNYMAFFGEAVARVKAASPDTRVGAGFEWDRFVKRVGPEYEYPGDSKNEAVLDHAFEAVILPFAQMSDFVALSSYRNPDDTEDEYPFGAFTVTDQYQFLRRLEPLYGLEIPVVFYSIGSPVDSPVAYLRQENYLKAFPQWAAGIEPEFVAWRQLLNYDGTDTASQEIAGRCLGFTGSNRDFALPVTSCYDGLVTSVFSKKDPFDYLQSPD